MGGVYSTHPQPAINKSTKKNRRHAKLDTNERFRAASNVVFEAGVIWLIATTCVLPPVVSLVADPGWANALNIVLQATAFLGGVWLSYTLGKMRVINERTSQH